MFLLMQRALSALCILCLCSCSSPACRQWELQEILTKRPCFNGGRLILGPDSNLSQLELELIRNRSGMRFYINLLLLQAYPCKEDPCLTKAEIIFEGQEPWIITPYLLEGGQRLQLPAEVSDQLIQALCDDRSFILKMGRSQIHAIPDNFMPGYEKLLAIPIEEDVPCEAFRCGF